jgi:protocatechuate 3,4-dioxygenase, alpha subunit
LIFPTTPSQTVGPYFAIGLPWPSGPHAVADGTPGALRISGHIYDGAGELVPDAMIETWQADPDGRLADLWDHGGPSQLEGFRGFARCGSDQDDGRYEIFTVKPGSVPGVGGPTAARQAPHIDVSVFARGLLNRLVTRIYFADEPAANATDPVLASIPDARRDTLLAQPTDDGYRFDIRLQGPGETVFFAV